LAEEQLSGPPEDRNFVSKGKLSDDDINALPRIVKYYWFQCGLKDEWIRNDASESAWTSLGNNALKWMTDPEKDGSFECDATSQGNGFNETKCPDAGAYTDRTKPGCIYQGISRNGAIWIH